MKYLETYKLFESKLVIDEMNDINEMLLELKDNGWKINIEYSPERWESDQINDYLFIGIQKYLTRFGKYTIKSIFPFSELSEYIYRIIDAYKENIITFEKIITDEKITKYNEVEYVKIQNLEIAEIAETDEFLGFRMKIQLKGQNLDNYHYPRLNEMHDFKNIMKNGKKYVEHQKRLKEDPAYLKEYKKFKDENIRKYWKELKPFKNDYDVPTLPRNLTDFHINILIDCGAVTKEKLEIDKWYYGDYRNSSFGKWDGKKFNIIRSSYDQNYWDSCFHFQDDDGFALFTPLREATLDEIKKEEAKV